jgi:hypothetical protein
MGNCACAGSELKALERCHGWLRAMTAFVLEVDREIDVLLHRESGNGFLAGEWVAFAQSTLLQLRDVEEQMQVWPEDTLKVSTSGFGDSSLV